MLLKKMLNGYRLILGYFYYTARPHSVNPINKLRIYNEGLSIRKLTEDHGELLKIIIKMTAESDSTGCGFGDYLKLYETVRTLKPKFVLECGSGISSCVISYALRENSQDGQKGLLVLSLIHI